MRVFKSKPFARFADKEGVADAQLCEVVRLAERGLIDVDLGGGVIKQRLARQGQGKSGGYRSLILFRRGQRAVFAYGYAKNNRENISSDELKVYRKLAGEMLAMSEPALAGLVKTGTIMEVYCNA
jgi:hypothetical protein